MKFEFLKNEYWYGGCVKHGLKMPISERSDVVVDTTVNMTPNQAMPLFISSKGRYIWNEVGFRASFKNGTIEVEDTCTVSDPTGNLKSGYLAAMKEHFPFNNGAPSIELFKNPVYNSWIELTFFQNQKDILEYADSILNNDMPAGVIMIDDGWAEYYGDWTFHTGKFPDPETMIDTLHKKGFKVMLWICPFISADTFKFREAKNLDLLIKDKEGAPYIVNWWNGYSAVLDMSSPKACGWLKDQLIALQALGVDGFKFDGGDSFFYRDDNITFANTTPNEQSIYWHKFGEQFEYNEYRATFNAGGAPIFQRLCDKHHTWGEEGIASLIPDSLLQGITGHPFSCPDMIGGGEYLSFQNAFGGAFDQELFVRYCEIAALMPSMQFSADPFRVLNKENADKVKQCVRKRQKYQDYIVKCVEDVCKSGEPVIRYMAYEFPDEDTCELIDQFMLGDRYLVAPITKKGVTGRDVYLPKGNWTFGDKTITSAGESVFIEQGNDSVIVLEKQD